MRYGCDLCLCPSRVEPFGYVDIEFAWHGTLTVGALVGGLGKVPGVYYRVQEHGDQLHMLQQFKQAILRALSMTSEERLECGRAGLNVGFPYAAWSAALEDQYSLTLAAAGTTLPHTRPQ